MSDADLSEVGVRHTWESPLPADLLDGVAPPAPRSVLPDGAPAPLLAAQNEGGAEAARSRSILEHGWWAVVAWVGGLLLGANSLADNSFLTHLATGRLIRTVGAPHADVFTFASRGKPIVVQSWLASWWYATLEAVGGPTAIRLFVSLTCGLLLVTLWRLSRPAGSLLGRICLTSGAAVVGLLWWNERPQIIGFAALALVAVVVTERRNPLWLVPLFALWVDVHGSFPLGVAYVGATLVIGAVAARRVTRHDVAVVGAVAAGLLAGAAISPYGLQMLTFPVELLGRSQALQFITEWRPLSFTIAGGPNTNNIVFVIEAVGVLAVLVWRRSWLRLLVAAAFVGLALVAVRNVAVAALVLVPLCAPALAGLGTPDDVVRPSRRRLLVVGAIGAALVVVRIVATPAYDWNGYPTRAVDWMEARGQMGRGTAGPRVLTHDYVGNYLEWRYGAQADTWFDDRAELHDYTVARDYVFLLSGIGDPDVLLARHPHDMILWQADTKLAKHLATDRDYRIVYRDDEAIVACRIASDRC